jgi:hypothetical protein
MNRLGVAWDLFWYNALRFCSNRITARGKKGLIMVMKESQITPQEITQEVTDKNPPTYH